MELKQPLSFLPNVHRKLWGEESWEVSVRSDSPSIVRDGPLAGKPLNVLLPEFPLLVKIIRARERLSVQVHPNERTASVTGGEPKTEMWCFLKKGFIYAGFKPGTTRTDVEHAVRNGTLEERLVRYDGEAGDVFFIPGGLVHAIGDDTELYEVQQSSDTTFRLFDWNRRDEQGKERPLHLEQALAATDFSLPPPKKTRQVTCPYFSFTQLEEEQKTITTAAISIVHRDGKTLLVPEKTVVSGKAWITTF